MAVGLIEPDAKRRIITTNSKAADTQEVYWQEASGITGKEPAQGAGTSWLQGVTRQRLARNANSQDGKGQGPDGQRDNRRTRD